MTYLLFLFHFLSFAGCEASKSTKSIPTIAEQFTLRTTEIDDTNHGTISVQQTIFFDRTNRRSHMVADGTLCQGHVEEIIRCDAGWTSGYTLTMGGPPGQHPSQWDCTNRTLFHPTPSTCPFAPFFSFPDNATYFGVTNITQHNISFPVVCDAWMFWKAGEQWMFYAQKDASVPARIQKIRTFHNNNTTSNHVHVWHIDFTHFAPGPPEPLSVFAPPASVTCKKTVPLTLKSSKQVRGCGVGIDFDRRRRRNDIQRKKTEQTTSTSTNTVVQPHVSIDSSSGSTFTVRVRCQAKHLPCQHHVVVHERIVVSFVCDESHRTLPLSSARNCFHDVERNRCFSRSVLFTNRATSR